MTGHVPGEYQHVVVEPGGNPATLRWFVVPYGGWWYRWLGKVEVTWPNGSVDVVWCRSFRHHEKATTTARQKAAHWSDTSLAGDESGSSRDVP